VVVIFGSHLPRSQERAGYAKTTKDRLHRDLHLLLSTSETLIDTLSPELFHAREQKNVTTRLTRSQRMYGPKRVQWECTFGAGSRFLTSYYVTKTCRPSCISRPSETTQLFATRSGHYCAIPRVEVTHIKVE